MILRIESRRMFTSIHGHGKLLSRAIEEQKTLETPRDLKEWCAQIVENAEMMRDLIDALSRPDYREDRGLPELRPYDTLLDAVMDAAQRLDLPLAQAFADPSKVFLHSEYPLVLLDLPNKQREITFDLVQSRYRIELLSLIDNRIFRPESEIWPESLIIVATVIDQWLLENRTADEIHQSLAH